MTNTHGVCCYVQPTTHKGGKGGAVSYTEPRSPLAFMSHPERNEEEEEEEKVGWIPPSPSSLVPRGRMTLSPGWAPKPEGALRIAAMDVGVHNFAHYVEDVPRDATRRWTQAELVPDVRPLWRAGTWVSGGVVDLAPGIRFRGLTMAMRRALLAYFERTDALWRSCDVIVIEQQFNGGTRRGRNMAAIRLSEVAMGLLLQRYSSFSSPRLEFVPSHHKTRFMPPGLAKPARKRLAVRLAHALVCLREEGDGACRSRPEGCHGPSILGQRGKRDDIADCVLMVQAYLFHRLPSGRRERRRRRGEGDPVYREAWIPPLPGTRPAFLRTRAVMGRPWGEGRGDSPTRWESAADASTATGVPVSIILSQASGRTRRSRIHPQWTWAWGDTPMPSSSLPPSRLPV